MFWHPLAGFPHPPKHWSYFSVFQWKHMERQLVVIHFSLWEIHVVSLLLKALLLLAGCICTLPWCYRRRCCLGWKLRAKGHLLSQTWAHTSRVMEMFYINSPSDGAVLEVKTRTAPLPPCMSSGPSSMLYYPALRASESSIICLCTFICRVK